MTKNTNLQRKKNIRRRRIIWSVFAFLVVSIIIGNLFFFKHVIDGLPPLEDLENPKPKLASNVFSSDGELIGQFFRENRMSTDIDSIPDFAINALIGTEDREFYDHWGVDLQRFVQAQIKNIIFMTREGASTITQQMIKNQYYLKVGSETPFETIVRKFREWITAVRIEQTYTKKEILEMYFNISYFGRGAYGIETATKMYFNKELKDLTLPEAAILIALLKSPSYYDPVRHTDNALRRRNLVMYNMIEPGFITRAEYDSLKNVPIDISIEEVRKGFVSEIAPHYTEYVRQQMEELSKVYGFDIYEDGLTIYTSLDTRMQRFANTAVKTHLDEFQAQFDKNWNWRYHRDVLDGILEKAAKNTRDYRNAKTREEKQAVIDSYSKNVAFVDSVQKIAQTIEVGFVVLDVPTGEIKAMVGGRDQEFSYGLNHVTQIRRQPGSSFKPVIYTVAMDNGLYPAYPILNQPFVYGPDEWSPNNFDMSTGGFVTLRDGLRESMNIIAARLIIEDHVQLWKVKKYAERMGIKTRLNLVPSIALGSSEVSPMELTSVYATLANKGIYTEPISILKIEDKDGILIDSFSPQRSEAISAETAYLVTNMMQSVVDDIGGSGRRIRNYFQRPAAGKTGTTQDYGDAWFVGFTPQFAAGAWVGFDDRRVSFTGAYGQGARAALPIWAMFMKEAYDSLDLPLEYFTLPESGNIVSVDYCKETIYELGDPKLNSSDCTSGILTDISNFRDVPPPYNAERDTTVKIFDKYWVQDSTAHEAVEIIDE